MRFFFYCFLCTFGFVSFCFGDATFGVSSPSDGSSFRTTSVDCSVIVSGITTGGACYFYHSSDLQFISSTTVKLTAGTDYMMYTDSASIQYQYHGFNEGTDNWYRWGYIKGPTSEYSDSYQISVLPNEAPIITIIQPDDKSFTGVRPYFEILLTDEGEGIDESSINFSLADSLGNTVFSFTGNSAGIFNASTNKLSYTCTQNLSPAYAYTLSISASDKGYREPYTKTTAQTITFNAKSEAITDLIPIPSPFNPSENNCVIQYTLQNASDNVEVNIYDMSYRLVRTIVSNSSRNAGENTADTWDGKDFAGQSLANGVYFIEVSAGSAKRYSAVILMGK